ncbi:site-specific integrase [Pseudomonas aeruginosa]|uniref:site-specific integrase n=1 Tax=Pseudomonas aeruginosa TaxID=287 RepID=UPI003907EB07
MSISNSGLKAIPPLTDRLHPYVSLMGYTFNLSDGVWKLSKDARINIDSLIASTPDSLKISLRYVMAYFCERYSPGYLKAISMDLRDLFSETKCTSFDEVAFINYRASSKRAELRVARLRSFLRHWHKLGYEGVSRELVDMLDSWRIKGALKGQRVKRLDPTQGPFSDLELEAFNDGAVAAYETGDIDIEQLAISLLISNTGRRPIQITYLKLCDIWASDLSEPQVRYFVNVPRAKQGLEFREEFRTFEVTKELWVVLKAQANAVERWYLQKGGENYPELIKQLPLFPGKRALARRIGSPSLISCLEKDELHMRSEYITATLKKVSEASRIHSHRTEKELHVFATRFRYTVGTRGAREGLNKYVIAELLDHSDIQHVDTYTLNVPEHVKRIDEAVAYQLIPIAQAFAGVLVDSEKDALRGNDSRSRVRTKEFNCGTCGHHGFCGALAPISCYTCIHFQAWVDAPHEEVLRDLIAERIKVIETTGDLTIAAVNDRTIFAIAEVVKRCEARRRKVNGQDDSDE